MRVNLRGQVQRGPLFHPQPLTFWAVLGQWGPRLQGGNSRTLKRLCLACYAWAEVVRSDGLEMNFRIR